MKLNKQNMYLLGLFWADANFIGNNIRLEILEEDMNEIKHLLNGFRFYTRVRKNRKPTTLAYISNNNIHNYLMSIGYEKRQILSQNITNHKYFKYWIRGLIDGDGCFYFNKKNSCRHFIICSNYNQDWLFFTDLLDKLCIRYKIEKYQTKTGCYSKIRITNKNDILKFGNYLGYNKYDNIGLKRKYNKWMEIIA